MIFAEIETHGWELLNAIEEHHKAPQTFDIPSEEERFGLRTGQMVKLLFAVLLPEFDKPTIQVERMWVTITALHNCVFQGRLESLPALTDRLHPGDIVFFTPDHVATVMIPRTDPRHPDFNQNP